MLVTATAGVALVASRARFLFDGGVAALAGRARRRSGMAIAGGIDGLITLIAMPPASCGPNGWSRIALGIAGRGGWFISLGRAAHLPRIERREATTGLLTDQRAIPNRPSVSRARSPCPIPAPVR